MPTSMLSRRTLLRGAAGASLCLPALEIMLPRRARAADDPIPKRYIYSYGGVATGKTGQTAASEMLVPSAYGDLAQHGAGMYALAPLNEQGLLPDVSLISNLLVPWGSPNNLPPGGRDGSLEVHFGPSTSPQLGGLRITGGGMVGPSSDQLLVEDRQYTTRFPSLAYLVQPSRYIGTDSFSNKLSWARNGNGVQGVPAHISPAIAYASLFEGFRDDGASPEEIAAAARRSSVLDRVGDAIGRVQKRLGAADKQRLERHLELVQSLERRVSDSFVALGQCEHLPGPENDPAIGGEVSSNGETNDGQNGWSNENLRTELLGDLLAMALACDQTRIATFQLTWWKCWMSGNFLGGGQEWGYDSHQIGHSGFLPDEAHGDVVAWHIRQYAYLVKRLSEFTEADGSRLLDHTAVVLGFEAGHGYDPSTGHASSPHSTENMSVLLAGGEAMGLKPGQHINGAERHPAQVSLSGMRAAGYSESAALGDFSTPVEEAFA